MNADSAGDFKSVLQDTYNEQVTQKRDDEPACIERHIDRLRLGVEEILPRTSCVVAVINVGDLHSTRLNNCEDGLYTQEHNDVAEEETGSLPLPIFFPEVACTYRPEDELHS